ncbi:MAG: FKBP-type peptidyl-prolyl cis-trans isomerase [Flavobacteriales bacterium]|nr:FKBP-type peptidyl-prolyl cis-trans isomerase [Flavobacteriales bacterium]
MKKINLLIVSIALVFISCTENATYKTPETEIEQVSYIIATNMAQGLKSQGLDTINADAVAKAFKDVFEDNELAISEEESNEIMKVFSEKMIARQKEKSAKANEVEITYLAENGEKEGVTTTESGLQYEVITSGGGEKPTAADQVTVHYHGMLTDGTVFDSSVDRGQPASFGVTQVIKGWTEALQLMSVGDKWKLTIPADLAYGDQGAGGMIGPGSTLVFEVELLGIN